MSVSDFERALIAATQEGIPRSRDPYGWIGRLVGATRERVIEGLRKLKREGTLRRVGALVAQRRVGIAGNVMVVWQVPPERLGEVGKAFAALSEVSHCYARETRAGWPFNLYTMVHASSEDACRRIVEEMSRKSRVHERKELFTVRELHKRPPTYYGADEVAFGAPYPVGLLLFDRLCVVVGGGPVARRKAESLLASGARVRIVAAGLEPETAALAGVELVRETYRAEHLAGARVVIAATDSAEVNRQVARDAEAAGALANVVDDPGACDFLVPARLDKGALMIAVQTRGASPALAATLCRRIGAMLPEGIENFAAALARARDEVFARVPDPRRRREVLSHLGSEEALQLFEREGLAAFRERVKALLTPAGEKP
ncbi:MAG: NAD(P)-dependent oxidoreductase [Planctomycetota bacterium]